MPRLSVASYNTYGERNGRDPLVDALLREDETLICLQEVSPVRAWEIKRDFGPRAQVSLAKHGLQFLALVLPEAARFLERYTVQLNGYYGLLPAGWSVRRAYRLWRAGRPGWGDCLEPRVAQAARVLWCGREFRVVNAHLPLEAGLRNRCLPLVSEVLGSEEALLVGDLNATLKNLFLADLLLAEGLSSAGREVATHVSGRKIDHVLLRGCFREVGYSTERGMSDHLLVRTELEV